MKRRFPAGPDTDVDSLLADLGREPEGGRLKVGDERIAGLLFRRHGGRRRDSLCRCRDWAFCRD